jgi:protocatechuate 3,4-dioxygenase, alpha subunit
VRDAQIEIWQANSEGKYAHPDDPRIAARLRFHRFSAAVTDFKTDLWWFETVKPGVVPGRHARPQAPHISAIIFARGINIGLHTRIYFDDEREKNKADPVLNLIEVAPRRETLVAKREKREGQVVYHFDVRLQGDQETVFFDV